MSYHNSLIIYEVNTQLDWIKNAIGHSTFALLSAMVFLFAFTYFYGNAALIMVTNVYGIMHFRRCRPAPPYLHAISENLGYFRTAVTHR